MKFSLKAWNKPTPKIMRNIGDALLAVAAFITPVAVYMEKPWVATTVVIMAIVGKFLTKLFAEKESEKQE